MRSLAIAINVLLLLSSLSQAQSTPALVRFLQDYVGVEGESKNTEYAAALVDLKDKGTKEAIIYLWNNGWCGTGGCTMLILGLNDENKRMARRERDCGGWRPRSL